MSACALTVLRSSSGVMTKRVGYSDAGWNTVAFSAGTYFSVHERAVASFVELAVLLERISRDPRAAVVRGQLRPGVDCARVRRLSDRAEHGDAVTFEPRARRWIGLDIDGVPEPPCLTFAAEPEAGVEHVLGLLPEPFADASCWWQATSSAGIKPGIRCRLWFWLESARERRRGQGLACSLPGRPQPVHAGGAPLHGAPDPRGGHA